MARSTERAGRRKAVNIALFDALDLCWEILAEVFESRETGIRAAICERFWPARQG